MSNAQQYLAHGEQFDDQRREIAGLREENARLTAQVAELTQQPPWMDVMDLEDAATALADAEPKAGETELQQAMKTHDVLSAIRTPDGDYVPFSVRHKLHERLDELVARVDDLAARLVRTGAYIDTRLTALEAARDDHGGKLANIHERLAEGDIRELKRIKRLDDLAARVQQAEGVARVSRDYVPRHTRRMDQMQREIDNLRKALEAARQPQPTPSAPVTDAVVDVFCAVYFPTWKDAGPNNTTWIKGEVRPALEAAFAARDAEEGQGDDPHTGRR